MSIRHGALPAVALQAELAGERRPGGGPSGLPDGAVGGAPRRPTAALHMATRKAASACLLRPPAVVAAALLAGTQNALEGVLNFFPEPRPVLLTVLEDVNFISF
ncbi:hypothetical protein R1flu_007946 [Riccia fluitans]|uniref:Uncharacterized protein n=1 Tax=Riccia fluitans TaxID=41844 RepID=A0ABD1XEP1_9MARC